MPGKLSRRQIAAYIAEQHLAGVDVTRHVAAYLVDTKRTRELELLVRDVESELLARNVVVADVASARALTDTIKRSVKQFVSDQYSGATVQLRESVDPTLLGGVKIQTPDAEIDRTLRRRLTNITKAKV